MRKFGVVLDSCSALILESVDSRLSSDPLRTLPIGDARRAIADAWRIHMPTTPDRVTQHAVVVPGDAEALPATLFVPEHPAIAKIAYFHGGGWTLGGDGLLAPVAANLCNLVPAEVLLVDYRLAPEHPYPAPADDCLATARWLDQERGARPLIVAGESAGASLAATVARRAPWLVDVQVLLNPALDPFMHSASYDENSAFELSRADMALYWHNYLAECHSDPPADVNVLGTLLDDMASAVVVTAEFDPLRDEGERYARELERAGVAVEHRCLAGQPHSYFWMLGAVPSGSATLAWVARAIRDTLSAADAA